MVITKLDITAQVDAILDKHKAAIAQAKAKGEESGLTDGISKAIGACVVEIRNEIKRQGAIYVKEEGNAIKFVEFTHKNTKAAWRQAAEHVKTITKNWDDTVTDKVKRIGTETADAAAKIKQLKKDMTGHQAFRAGFCTKEKAIDVIEERNFKDLNTFYLSIREPPLKQYMALSDKWVKIAEHDKRVGEFVSLLPALEKKAKKQKAAEVGGVLAEVKKDAAAVSKAKNEFFNLPASVGKLKEIKKRLDDKKLERATYDSDLDRFEAHVKSIKSRKSEFKTCGILVDNIKTKCEGHEKDTDFKGVIKQAKAEYKEMDGYLKDYIKAFDDAEKARKGAAKKLGV